MSLTASQATFLMNSVMNLAKVNLALNNKMHYCWRIYRSKQHCLPVDQYRTIFYGAFKLQSKDKGTGTHTYDHSMWAAKAGRSKVNASGSLVVSSKPAKLPQKQFQKYSVDYKCDVFIKV